MHATGINSDTQACLVNLTKMTRGKNYIKKQNIRSEKNTL